MQLLESCVTNCGKEFRAEMCDQQILNDLRDLAKGVSLMVCVCDFFVV